MTTSMQPFERHDSEVPQAPRIPRGPRETTRRNPAGLTVREAQVLELLSQGYTNARIARVLYRSQKTVDHHVSAILSKLGVNSRAQAVAAAFASGMLGACLTPGRCCGPAAAGEQESDRLLWAARMPVTVHRRTVVTEEFLADKVDMLA
jgi:DNA-binding CsgD family transcriptional regulator